MKVEQFALQRNFISFSEERIIDLKRSVYMELI